MTADQPDKLRELIASTRQKCADDGCGCFEDEEQDCMGHRAEALADALEAALVVLDATKESPSYLNWTTERIAAWDRLQKARGR